MFRKKHSTYRSKSSLLFVEITNAHYLPKGYVVKAITIKDEYIQITYYFNQTRIQERYLRYETQCNIYRNGILIHSV